jgi:probable rRNA maturation factor
MNTVLDQPAVPGGDAASGDERSCDEEPPSRLRLALERVDDDGDWTAFGPVDELIAGVARVLAEAAELSGAYPATAAVALSSNTAVRRLNAAYRGKDKPTNVLSFPMVQADLIGALDNTDDGEVLLGDIILAQETCAREAHERGISLADHTAHLIVHGTLHLVGHDHENDAEAEAMEALEIRALETLGLPDPYGDRGNRHAGPIDETGI